MFRLRNCLSALFLSLFSLAANATNYGNYVMEKEGETVYIKNERYGEWTTWIGDVKKWPAGAKRQQLSFEFETPDYFREDNKGHFFLLLMASPPHKILNGRGVVIGNVSGYPASKGGCSKSPYANAVVVEHFWEGGNCVYGSTTSSVPLSNNVRYKLTIAIEKPLVEEQGRLTRYKLEQKDGIGWKELNNVAFYDDKKIVTGEGGFTIGEVFSTHNWQFNIYNLEETFE